MGLTPTPAPGPPRPSPGAGAGPGWRVHRGSGQAGGGNLWTGGRLYGQAQQVAGQLLQCVKIIEIKIFETPFSL